MKILDLNELKNYQFNSVVTLGFFDGVHKAHQILINRLVSDAKNNNYKSVIITFSDEILSLFKITNNIQTLSQKLECFSKLNVDYVLVLSLKDNFKDMSALTFKEEILDKLNTKEVICGSDFSFAKNKEGNLDFIKNKTNYQIVEIADEYLDDKKISSTYIRELLKVGNIELANKLLFNDFEIRSKVIHGNQIGRTIDFKTANLAINNQCNLLKTGVYFGIIKIEDKKYKTMINVGINPTINKDSNLKVEAHILDFNEQLYEKEVSLIFICFRRDEMTFESIDALKNRLKIDLDALKKYKFN